jgi:hypothetical protein
MCKFALARGTVSDVLAVIEVMYDNQRLKPDHMYPIGGFFKYLINFEPQDQGISLKAYEKKVTMFHTFPPHSRLDPSY